MSGGLRPGWAPQTAKLTSFHTHAEASHEKHQVPEISVRAHHLSPPAGPADYDGLLLLLGESDEADLGHEPGQEEGQYHSQGTHGQQENGPQGKLDPVNHFEMNIIGERVIVIHAAAHGILFPM